MQVKSIAECSKGILQYFLPSSYHLSLRPLFFFYFWVAGYSSIHISSGSSLFAKAPIYRFPVYKGLITSKTFCGFPWVETSTAGRVYDLCVYYMTGAPEGSPKVVLCGLITSMGESLKCPKSWTFKISILKLAVCLVNIHNFKIKWSVVLRQTENKSEKLI